MRQAILSGYKIALVGALVKGKADAAPVRQRGFRGQEQGAEPGAWSSLRRQHGAVSRRGQDLTGPRAPGQAIQRQPRIVWQPRPVATLPGTNNRKPQGVQGLETEAPDPLAIAIEHSEAQPESALCETAQAPTIGACAQ